MPFHVVVLTRQQVAAGALGFQDELSRALMQHMMELGQKISALRADGYPGQVNVPSSDVEVYALGPFPLDEFLRARQQFGRDAFTVLFPNDAAREACERYGIQLDYGQVLPDGELPPNIAVLLRMKHYGDIAP